MPCAVFLAACCIVASEEFVHAHALENQSVEIVAQSMATDTSTTFESKSAMEVVGFSMTKRAADRTFEAAGIRGRDRSEVGVVELHDCFAANEVGNIYKTVLQTRLMMFTGRAASHVRCAWAVRAWQSR